MRTDVLDLLPLVKPTEALLFNMLEAPLSSVPFHNDTPSITRYFAKDFPVHLAVHEVSAIRHTPVEYTLPHVHEDTHEVNIILSKKYLRYRIVLGRDEYIVDANTSIWIPRGMMHSANVLEGEGMFVTMRFKS